MSSEDKIKYCWLVRMTLKAVSQTVRKAIETANEVKRNNELMVNSYKLSGLKEKGNGY